MQRIVKYRRWGLLFVLFATFLVYANTLTHQFVWDDQQFIFDWQTPKLGLSGITPMFLGDTPMGHENVYRPMRGIYYLISSYILETNPFLYHVQAIVIHLAGTLAAYVIIRKLLHREVAALIGALVFGLHPLHVESVAWVTSSFDTLGQVIALFAFYAYLRWSQAPTKTWRFLSLLLTAMAIFSHETAVMLPVYMLLHHLIFKKRTSLINHLPYWAIAAAYWLIRIPLLQIISRQPYPFDSPLYTAWMMGGVFVKYLQNLILPLTLTVNHPLAPGINALFWADLNHFYPPPPPSLFNPIFLISWLIIIALVFLTYRLRSTLPVVSFGLAWIGFSLLPVMQAIPISTLYGERYAYPASFGFALLFAWVFLIIQKIKLVRLSQPLFIVSMLLITFYAIKTPLQNTRWRDNTSLWSDAIKKNPLSNSNYTNLANSYYVAGDITRAVELYQQAISLNPSQAVNYTNIGIIEYHLEDRQAAIASFTKALELHPPSHIAHLYLGIVHHQQQQFDLAKKEYETFKARYPRYPDTYLYLGMLAHQQKDSDAALSYYIQALALKPRYADVYNNLGNLYRDLNQLAEAIDAYDTALTLNPNHPYAATNLADALQLSTSTASQSADKSL
jgi:protein O-mannosyl-transferase